MTDSDNDYNVGRSTRKRRYQSHSNNNCGQNGQCCVWIGVCLLGIFSFSLVALWSIRANNFYSEVSHYSTNSNGGGMYGSPNQNPQIPQTHHVPGHLQTQPFTSIQTHAQQQMTQPFTQVQTHTQQQQQMTQPFAQTQTHAQQQMTQPVSQTQTQVQQQQQMTQPVAQGQTNPQSQTQMQTPNSFQQSQQQKKDISDSLPGRSLQLEKIKDSRLYDPQTPTNWPSSLNSYQIVSIEGSGSTYSITVNYNFPFFIVSVPVRPSTGYRWYPIHYNSRYIELIGSQILPNSHVHSNSFVGGKTGDTVWFWKVKKELYSDCFTTWLVFKALRPGGRTPQSNLQMNSPTENNYHHYQQNHNQNQNNNHHQNFPNFPNFPHSNPGGQNLAFVEVIPNICIL